MGIGAFTLPQASSGGTTVTQVQNQTLLVGSWTFVNPYYEYNLANANITVNSITDVIPENESVVRVQEAELLPKTVSSAGSVKLYCEKLPSGDIVVTLNIWE